MEEVKLPEDWLQRIVASVQAEVATWPEWMQQRDGFVRNAQDAACKAIEDRQKLIDETTKLLSLLRSVRPPGDAEAGDLDNPFKYFWVYEWLQIEQQITAVSALIGDIEKPIASV